MLEDTEDLVTRREVFLDQGLTVRSIMRNILQSGAYRSETGGARDVTGKLLSLDQFVSAVLDLTGFLLEHDGDYALAIGPLRALGGGVEGTLATAPATRPTVTTLLVQQRIAEVGAANKVLAEREL